MPMARQASVIDGKRRVEALAHVRGVEEDVVVDAAGRLGHPPADRRRHHVARGEVLLRVHAEHDPLAGAVVEDRPLAADGLADERLLADGVGAGPHHGGVELDELDVAHRQPGAQGERHAVAGDGRRVRRRGEDLAVAAGGQHDGAGGDGADGLDVADGVDQGDGDAGRLRVPSAAVPITRSRANARSRTSTPAASADSSSVRWTSAPLRSPPAWTMRLWLWPPSRVSAGPSPPASGSNAAPRRIR